MTNIHLKPITKIPHGCLNLPGSKSIANRALLLAAISHGNSILHNVPSSAEDVTLMREALSSLGITIIPIKPNATKIEHKNKDCEVTASYEIKGCSGKLPVSAATVFCGNSGTTIRFLTAILALMPGSYCLDGISRMHERPIGDLVVALQQIGAKIDYKLKEGYPPLQTKEFVDNQISRVKISGKISSQYLTGILMALPLLEREIFVEISDELISQPYVTITLQLLAKFGCKIIVDGMNYIVNKKANTIGNSKLVGVNYTIEPDASSASYFLAMGAIGGDITINHLSENSLQGDKNFAKILALMGANVIYTSDNIRVCRQGTLLAIDVNMEDMPDVAMTIAVIALFAKGTTTIRGIHSWKVKETDRLLAMHNELTKLGASVVITESTITITPPKEINRDIMINTYNDHRMAMCFSLLAVYGIPVVIKDYECVNKTFPNYFMVFKELCYT